MATTFLNLANQDWLERFPVWVEALLIILSGCVIGAFVVAVRPLRSLLMAGGVCVLTLVGAASLSYFTKYWFPWLIIAGAQVPCAVACMAAAQVGRNAKKELPKLGPTGTEILPAPDRPDAPDYVFVGPPFGAGAFGKVWLGSMPIAL